MRHLFPILDDLGFSFLRLVVSAQKFSESPVLVSLLEAHQNTQFCIQKNTQQSQLDSFLIRAWLLYTSLMVMMLIL